MRYWLRNQAWFQVLCLQPDLGWWSNMNFICVPIQWLKPPTISGVESGPRIMGCRGSCGQYVCIIYTLIIYVVVYLIIYVQYLFLYLRHSRVVISFGQEKLVLNHQTRSVPGCFTNRNDDLGDDSILFSKPI